MNDAQREIALFRYSLIREAADDSLTIRQRGVLVRELAARHHAGPSGRRVRDPAASRRSLPFPARASPSPTRRCSIWPRR